MMPNPLSRLRTSVFSRRAERLAALRYERAWGRRDARAVPRRVSTLRRIAGSRTGRVVMAAPFLGAAGAYWIYRRGRDLR